MFPVSRSLWHTCWAIVLCLSCCTAGGASIASSDAPPAPDMPSGWKVEIDFEVPSPHVASIAEKLGAEIESLRNTIYDVNGKRVQLNVIVTPDSENAEKLMAKLKSMKSDVGLLRKNLTIYEFVGKNDVLPIILEGRKHLDSP